ncbi:MAG: SIMPL domain-containing protein [Deltaproteobacteria bacterium]|nr:SIMPL domain-containing protein [Deltaproteobacteria bacterium]MBW2417190.1 SIMPL domain-containing protein [Deltaproteobacteria bacterium]
MDSRRIPFVCHTRRRHAAALLLLGALGFVLPGSALGDDEEPRVIRVSGEATASAPPDQVIVELAVVTERDRAADAVEENARLLDAVIAALRKEVGKQGRIETASYSLSPRYSYVKSSNTRSLEGYTARNSLRITLDDLDRVGAVIDRGTAAGANEVQSLKFTLKNDEPQHDEALRAAALRAMAKARTIADALGLDVEEVISVDETTRVVRPAYAEMAAGRASAATPVVAPGGVDVRAQVNLRVGVSPRDR